MHLPEASFGSESTHRPSMLYPYFKEMDFFYLLAPISFNNRASFWVMESTSWLAYNTVQPSFIAINERRQTVDDADLAVILQEAAL